MSRRLMIWSAPVIASILASACAGRQPPSPFDAGRGDGEIRVEVDNDNYLDVAVFAMHDQAATRLGTVSGLSSATLSVPGQWVVMGRLRLLVDPIGSAEAYLTEDIPVSP
ncbi:MAG: hypothetical protein GWM92_09960, partial [Gemmatimonadetes bacterium]|nr:hypothetical protein [Gemmatimonadota bacterium]NIR35939.1 hypothetical protein [Actinomycetota bacterium]NIU79488.1 hypothetical protein [Gammaproteobacteria bacterium]NIT87642.1 hypothetical protein [Gemmatimonadota bacterium]NIY12514.1 hypothetical protein [Gemmatimonadota bacterium]